MPNIKHQLEHLIDTIRIKTISSVIRNTYMNAVEQKKEEPKPIEESFLKRLTKLFSLKKT